MCAIAVVGLLAGRAGFIYTYIPPAVASLSGFVGSLFASRMTAVLAGLAAAASLGLFVAGWGIPLTSAQTEAAVAAKHPTFGRPIRCHRVSGGGFLAQRYECSWRGSRGEMAFDVDDSSIVAEYP